MKTPEEWENLFNKLKKEGYDILWFGYCPNCQEKAIQIHRIGVVRTVCGECGEYGVGFGGPNCRSWEGAVAWGNASEEERKKHYEEVERKKIENFENAKRFIFCME